MGSQLETEDSRETTTTCSTAKDFSRGRESVTSSTAREGESRASSGAKEERRSCTTQWKDRSGEVSDDTESEAIRREDEDSR